MDSWIENLHLTHPQLEQKFVIHLRREWLTMPECERRGTIEGLTPNRAPGILNLNDFEKYPNSEAQDAAFTQSLREVDAEFKASLRAPKQQDTPQENRPRSSSM